MYTISLVGVLDRQGLIKLTIKTLAIIQKFCLHMQFLPNQLDAIFVTIKLQMKNHLCTLHQLCFAQKLLQLQVRDENYTELLSIDKNHRSTCTVLNILLKCFWLHGLCPSKSSNHQGCTYFRRFDNWEEVFRYALPTLPTALHP